MSSAVSRPSASVRDQCFFKQADERLYQRVDACFSVAEAHVGRVFARPTVVMNIKGRAAGMAHLQRWALRFNSALYHANQAAFLAEVVPHEVAHLLVYALWGTSQANCRVLPHGQQWQSVMRTVFKLEPRTTHCFDLAVLAEQTMPYHCGCRSHSLSLRRHQKVLRGTARYQCRHCRQPLQPEVAAAATDALLRPLC